MILSFLFFLGVFVAIGLSSMRKATQTKQDYYLASRGVAPWLVGLSAVATNNSGYMFIGVIGYTYATGLASIWLMFGWILGDLMASLLVHRRLREATEETGAMSYVGVLNGWGNRPSPLWERAAAVLAVVFLLAYAAAQLVAGSKALHVLLDWPLWAGAVMAAVIVCAYCWAGGIRASIWTDAAQSIVMICAMGLLMVVAVQSLGGMSGAIDKMNAVDGFMDLFPKDLAVPGVAGGLLFALSWMFAGMSVIGQPHVMVRFMTLGGGHRMIHARLWYYLWFTAFYAMATGVGMLSRVLLDNPSNFDAELALPTIAMELLPPALVGLILAGIFAATISTADSLLLSCSAAVTHDLFPQPGQGTRTLKITTVAICGLALLWALANKQSVFALVIMSWSGLASAFAPLLLVRCFGATPNAMTLMAMSFGGLLVALVWRWAGLAGAVYEGMPGIIAGLLIFAVGHSLSGGGRGVPATSRA